MLPEGRMDGLELREHRSNTISHGFACFLGRIRSRTAAFPKAIGGSQFCRDDVTLGLDVGEPGEVVVTLSGVAVLVQGAQAIAVRDTCPSVGLWAATGETGQGQVLLFPLVSRQ